MHKRLGYAVGTTRSQAGFTLIEVLIVCLLTAVVVGAVATPMVVSAKNQKRSANYSYAQEQARAGLDMMVSQVRQATSILASTPNSIEMNVSLRGVALTVLYECDIPQTGTSYRECIRVQAAQGANLPSLTSGEVVIRNLINGTTASPVFTLYPTSVSPYYMTATLSVPASGGAAGGLTTSVVFSDGALMRNLNVDN
jgi:Tfp pilus assembly protein PilW